MRILNNEEIEAPPNLMPLIDMVFLLLIFFLVASSLSQEELEQNLELPRTTKVVRPMSSEPIQLIVNILHDGSIKIAGRTIKPKELQAMFIKIATDEPERKIRIRGDKRCLFQYFAAVLDMASSCGINPAKIGYLPNKPSSTPATPG